MTRFVEVSFLKGKYSSNYKFLIYPIVLCKIVRRRVLATPLDAL